MWRWSPGVPEPATGIPGLPGENNDNTGMVAIFNGHLGMDFYYH
jgi:hypothetical protein